MGVPGYQDFMLPLLKIAADVKEHKVAEAMDALAPQLGITEEERELMLPSGTQTRFYNRVTWAMRSTCRRRRTSRPCPRGRAAAPAMGAG